jgi:Tol biopolymer transport system component
LLVAALGFLGAITAGTLSGVPPASATSPGRDGRLVAVEGKIDAGLPCGDPGGHTDCGHDDSIVTFRGDGDGRKLLSRHVTSDDDDRYSGSTWSPDGRRIAFLSGLRPATMRGDGTHRRLLRPTCCFYSLAWARDGNRLLLGGSSTSTSNDGIYELRIKDHHLRRLTHGHDSDPAMSTTGAIAFVRRASGGASWSYLIRRPGEKPSRLLRGTEPDWSPDGKQLVFARGDGLHIASVSGHMLRRLTNSKSAAAPDRAPAWSPHGTRVAFVRYPDVYIVRRDGTHAHRVPLSDSQNLFWESPSWQPLR